MAAGPLARSSLGMPHRHEDKAPSSSSSTTAPAGDVCPKRFGLNFDPPSIILEYLQTETGKLFHRRIGLRRLRPSADAARVAEKLRQKNEVLLAEDKVSFEQLVSLIKKLQGALPENVNGDRASEEASGARRGGGPRVGGQVPAAEVEQALHIRQMSGERLTLRLASTDPISKVKVAIEQRLDIPCDQQELVHGEEVLCDNSRTLQSYGLSDGAELSLVAVYVDYNALDLNKLSDEELKRHKARMDVEFFKNQKKPGDPGFVYDVQVDFSQEGSDPCGWDSDSVESEEEEEEEEA